MVRRPAARDDRARDRGAHPPRAQPRQRHRRRGGGVAPTLVTHPRDDALVTFAEGRLVATLIPGARFVPLESRNHILLADEPAWTAFREEVERFLGAGAVETTPEAPDLADLSNREVAVLELVADGLGNDEIAARLFISVRTVERHLSNVYVKLGLSGRGARAAAAARLAASVRAGRHAAEATG
jgi:DNA-binding CsgD family transcriptional regulator